MNVIILAFEEEPTEKNINFWKQCHFFDDWFQLGKNVFLATSNNHPARWLAGKISEKCKVSVFETECPSWGSSYETPELIKWFHQTVIS